MLKTLFPATVDNTFRGRSLALWVLAFVVLVKLAQIVAVMIDGPGIVTAADGIPLDTFPAAAGQTVVAAFVAMAISRLLVSVVCVLVLWRYRSAAAMLFTLLALHDVARELVLRPVRTEAAIGMIVNIILILLTVAGVALSVTRSGKTPPMVTAA